MNQAKQVLPGKVRLKFVSRQRWRRPAFIPSIIFLTADWLLVLSLLSLSLIGLLHTANAPGLLIVTFAAAVVLFGVLSIFTLRYFADFTAQYELEMTDEEIRLKVSEKHRKVRVDQMNFNEVDFVEYFSPRDNASFLFHGKDGRIIDVPAWSLTDKPDLIVDFLDQKDLPIKQV
jgi:hypothetical protein